MKMLDIGVGGGRTTTFFANAVKEYVGTDYSEKMITTCKKKFSESSDNIRFEVCDVRDMTMFPNKYFDFILFSLNGIDYLSHDDRLKAFGEIRSVGKSGGYFCFSTHNLLSIPTLFAFRKQFTGNCRTTVDNLRRCTFLRFVRNQTNVLKDAKHSTYLIIKDHGHEYRTIHYYIKPVEQIKQLTGDFYDFQVYSSVRGARIENQMELDTIEDPWLYYLCHIK